MRQIGVRELRQQASEHLRAVDAGESIVITDRGRPVARLVPASPLEQHLAALLRTTSLVAPTRSRRTFATAVRLTGAALTDVVDDDRADRELFAG